MEKIILVVNDDGVNSPGIKAAVRALKPLGKVIVCAPAVQQSGVGRSISLFTPVSVSKTEIEGVEAYAVNGTPVDAVIVSVYGIFNRRPDLVVSGINIGENLSFEATTSGTIGAALEAANHSLPAIAISLHSNEKAKFEQIQPDQDFKLAELTVRQISEYILENGLPEGVDVLNVNVPERADKAKIKITRLAKRMYTTKVQKRRDPRGRLYFWIDGDAIFDAPEGTDVHAVRVENCISITPLSLDLTSHASIDVIEEIVENLERHIEEKNQKIFKG